MTNNKKFLILILFGAALLAFVMFFKISNIGTTALWEISDKGKWLLPLVAVSALIDSINPCAFSILILTIAFLFTLGKNYLNILKVGALYILGIFAVYILIGLGILQTLHLFNTPHFMAKVGASLLIAWGVVGLINVFFPAFPLKLRIPQSTHRWMAQLMEKGSAPTAFVLGGLVGLCEFPCTGGPYLMVLGLLHDRATYFSGLGYLIFYNIIFILPLVIILLIASNEALLGKVQRWKSQESKNMRLFGGIAMIALGIIIFLL